VLPLSRSRLTDCFMLLLSFSHSLPGSLLLSPPILRLCRIVMLRGHGSGRLHRTRRGVKTTQKEQEGVHTRWRSCATALQLANSLAFLRIQNMHQFESERFGISPVVAAACSLTAWRSRMKAFSPAWGEELARRRCITERTAGERSWAAKRAAPNSWRCMGISGGGRTLVGGIRGGVYGFNGLGGSWCFDVRGL